MTPLLRQTTPPARFRVPPEYAVTTPEDAVVTMLQTHSDLARELHEARRTAEGAEDSAWALVALAVRDVRRAEPEACPALPAALEELLKLQGIELVEPTGRSYTELVPEEFDCLMRDARGDEPPLHVVATMHPAVRRWGRLVRRGHIEVTRSKD